MRILPFLLLFSFLISAQPREDKPLPYFSEEPTSVMNEGIMGWSLSTDGQWVSDNKTILPRFISRNKKKYRRAANTLGLDNIEELQIYPVLYGNDTLIMLVKLFREGSYKYEVTKKGWRTYLSAYYFLFEQEEFSKLNKIKDTITQNLTIRLKDGGQINNVRRGNLTKRIKEKMLVRERYGRNLVLMIQPYTAESVVRFHIFSYHEVFKDVEGVRKDFIVDGESKYGSSELFDYIYYETKLSNFSDFFSYPTSYKFEFD